LIVAERKIGERVPILAATLATIGTFADGSRRSVQRPRRA
jgi:hypothetical protein